MTSLFAEQKARTYYTLKRVIAEYYEWFTVLPMLLFGAVFATWIGPAYRVLPEVLAALLSAALMRWIRLNAPPPPRDFYTLDHLKLTEWSLRGFSKTKSRAVVRLLDDPSSELKMEALSIVLAAYDEETGRWKREERSDALFHLRSVIQRARIQAKHEGKAATTETDPYGS